MTGTLFPDTPLGQRLRSAGTRLMWLAIGMIVVGAAAIVFPVVSTLVATAFIGALLLITGCLMLTASFAIHGTGHFFGALLFSLLSIGAGVFLLFNPAAGAMALTLALGVIFMVQSAFEIVLAFEIRPFPGWAGMLVSGLLSLLMALLIIATWPAISLVVLGILFGVNFISTGVGYMIISNGVRK